jgi:DNA-directed RNA polymerase subunit RPC12/RpoP
MAVRYLCDTCGYRGFAPNAATADEVLCEQCGEPVLTDPQSSVPKRQPTRPSHEAPENMATRNEAAPER